MRFCVLVLMSCVSGALAQRVTVPEPTVRDSQGMVLRAQSTVVLVPALVKTKSGEMVYALKAKDFVLTDNGVVQKTVLEEDAESQPLALVVLVQVGGDGARHLENYGRLGVVLDSMTEAVPHRVAVVGFDSEARVVQDFTDDMDRVGKTIKTMRSGDSGGAILDGLAYAVDMLAKQPVEYRRAILLLSETVDHGSHVTMEEALRRVSDTNTTIFSLGFSSSKAVAKREAPKIFGQIKGATGPASPGPPKGCMSKDDPYRDPTYTSERFTQTWDCMSLLLPPLRVAKISALMAMDGMQKNVPETVAELTGGEFWKFSDAKSVERGMVTISNHLPNRYVLSFQPQAPLAGLHVIGLKLPGYSDVVVTARSSYWMDGSASAEGKSDAEEPNGTSAH